MVNSETQQAACRPRKHNNKEEGEVSKTLVSSSVVQFASLLSSQYPLLRLLLSTIFLYIFFFFFFFLFCYCCSIWFYCTYVRVSHSVSASTTTTPPPSSSTVQLDKYLCFFHPSSAPSSPPSFILDRSLVSTIT